MIAFARFFSHDMSVRKDIEDLAKNVRARAIPTFGQTTMMPEGFVPGAMDVVCARGKDAFNHPGNRHLRVLIAAHLEAYKKADSKIQKSLIVSSIVDSVRQASPAGGFVKKGDRSWFEVGDHNAREKVGQRYVECSSTALSFGFSSRFSIIISHACSAFVISCTTSTRVVQKRRQAVAKTLKQLPVVPLALSSLFSNLGIVKLL
jgi:hypothetical protein